MGHLRWKWCQQCSDSHGSNSQKDVSRASRARAHQIDCQKESPRAPRARADHQGTAVTLNHHLMLNRRPMLGHRLTLNDSQKRNMGEVQAKWV